MSYFLRADESGRQPIVMVELLLDQCSLVYGNAPCTAAIGVTGATQVLLTLGRRAKIRKTTRAVRYCIGSIRRRLRCRTTLTKAR